jgi:hypothetical protein
VFAAFELYWFVRVPKKRKSKEMMAQDTFMQRKTKWLVIEDSKNIG